MPLPIIGLMSPVLVEVFDEISYTEPIKDQSLAMRIINAIIGLVNPKPKAGVGPQRLNSYGLAPRWSQPTALMNSSQEKEYIQNAIRALGVDAALVINDPGFAFSCEFCVGGSGAASTGSTFIASLVNKDGESVMDLHEYFATTDAQAAIAASIVNPLQQKKLFSEHGRKMAIVFAEFLKKNLAGQ